jgi:hypothetical protein
MSQQGVLNHTGGGSGNILTLSSEGGPPTPPSGNNFNFSGSVAGGSATNGALHFTTPGGPGAATDGQMDANVLVDGTSIGINASNQLHVIGSSFFSSINVQTFTSSGTYTPTAGTKYVWARMVGGGGGGGGATTSALSAGSGGGNGEYSEGVFSAATIGASQTVTIGAGGVGNSASGGSNGGTTSLGSLLTSVGGTGGGVVALTIVGSKTVAGGAGGTGGTGGSLRFPGSQGGFAWIMFQAGTTDMIFTGEGKPGPFSGGTPALTILDANNVQFSDGNTGTGYGCGGSGAIDYQNGSAQTGGSGSSGVIVIMEYIG